MQEIQIENDHIRISKDDFKNQLRYCATVYTKKRLGSELRAIAGRLMEIYGDVDVRDRISTSDIDLLYEATALILDTVVCNPVGVVND